MKRPEIQEEVLRRNIASRAHRTEILRTLPGFELFLGGSFDSNTFLTQHNWGNVQAELTQSINNIINAPARLRNSKNQKTLADVKRQTLALAIMVQTRLAKANFDFSKRNLQNNFDSYEAALEQEELAETEKALGLVSGFDFLQQKLDAQNKKFDFETARINNIDATATFLNTLGIRIYQSSKEIDPMKIAEALK